MKTVVLSDVHLNVTTYGETQLTEFSAFLRRLPEQGCKRLILLGDLFDFWFEYKHVIFSEYFHVLRAFAELNDAGVEMHLVCGNHDFWAGRFLEQYLGFTVHPDGAHLNFGDKRALLVHGDGQNKKDVGYRMYRRLAKARLMVRLFQALHPDLAMALAKRISRTSRRMTAHDDPGNGSEAAALKQFAREYLASGKSDVVICGHAHAAACEKYPTPTGTGIYLNTGDWLHHRSYVQWDSGEFRLVCPEPDSAARCQQPGSSTRRQMPQQL